MPNAHAIITAWPAESRDAAALVVAMYGEPDESTPSMLVWRHVGPWTKLVAEKEFSHHNFPVPHTDSVESSICHFIPLDKFNQLAQFDGSVTANRTRCELSARCHDVQANMLALNLADDIIAGRKTPEEARAYYAKAFLDHHRGKSVPYMQRLRFEPTGMDDPDQRIL